MLDEILVENPLEVKFSEPLHEYNTRTNEQTPLSARKGSARGHPKPSQDDMVLPGPPTPPTLAAPPPPVNRRKPPAAKPASNHPPPLPGNDAPIQQAAESNPDPAPYSARLESGPANQPQFSSRTNQSSYPPSALRARTPISDVTQQEHNPLPLTSAPVPQTNFVSPLPRPPMSASLRMQDRSDSIKSKDSRASENTKESNTAYERPMRSAKPSPAPRINGPPPLRSSRPGSAMGQRTPVAVAQHEGMI
jgi:hypothetical protein